MGKEQEQQAPAYVAFISYAREDEAFARRLEAEIEAWPRPRGEGPVHVFRDRSDFTGSAYEAALEQHMQRAAALIVVCSPHARRSDFVGDEIRRFARLNDPERIFPILVDGLPDNEADDLKSFPPALLEATRERGIPLGAEFRGIDLERDVLSRGRFEAEWYKLLGNLFDVPAAEIRESDQRRLGQVQRRNLLLAAAAIVALVGLALLMGWLWQRTRTAEHALDVMNAKSQALLSEAERALMAVTEEATRLRMASPPASQTSGTAASAAASGTASTPRPAEADLKPRVYFHIREDRQRENAQALKAALERNAGLGVLVPPIQRLDVGPTQSSELRYFRDSEGAEAERIGNALRAAGASDVIVKKVPGYENTPTTKMRPRHYELWLKPATGP